MYDLAKEWKEIFSVHEYFQRVSLKRTFVEDALSKHNDDWNKCGQGPANICSLYYSMISDKLIVKDNFDDEFLINLEYLIIDNSELDHLYPLQKFQNLKWLRASRNQIDSLVPIKSLQRLIYLDLESNKISNLQPVSYLVSLRHLDLSSNSVSDIYPITALTDLQVLLLAGNRIEHIPSLKGLKNLRELSIGNNRIRSLVGLYELPQLEKLSLGYNPISNEELVNIRSALKDCEIHLEYHPTNPEEYPFECYLEEFQGLVCYVTRNVSHNRCFISVTTSVRLN
ncbi:MAG: leucine-rich repeat domain-containing protein [Chitinophagaceae bacterium]|nr:MAG: leucine-rich repeat domain-containing protein [Chitinophagaceae bacterium]